MSEPRCPTCEEHHLLEEIVERDVSFLGCTTCFGLFVSTDELGEYVRNATGSVGVRTAYHGLLEDALDHLAGQSKRLCPHCGASMRRMGFGEHPLVILERCALHGVWLDKKELTKVLRAARADAKVKGLDQGEGELR